MNTRIPDHHTIQGGSFVMGVVTGGAIATGLARYFAPRLVSEVRQRVIDSATDLQHTVANGLADVVDRAADAADNVARHGHAVHDEVADAVGRGAHAVSRAAHDVERFAKASKTEQKAARS